METPDQAAARLLTALEDLIEQEGMYLRGGYYDLAAETRDRASPLVQQICATARLPDVGDYRPRIDALLTRSAGHAAFLADKLKELGAEIRRTDQARFRAMQMVPAYARSAGAAAPRFQAAG